MIEIIRIENTINLGKLSGATFTPNGRRQYLRTGYMASVTHGLAEMTIGWKDAYTLRDVVNILESLSPAHIKALGKFYIGFWKDEDGKEYFDVSLQFQSRKSALQVALNYDELAIWDNKNQKTVRVF